LLDWPQESKTDKKGKKLTKQQLCDKLLSKFQEIAGSAKEAAQSVCRGACGCVATTRCILHLIAALMLTQHD